MKTLIIARHGKAEKSEFGTFDFKRKLLERGKEDVQRVSELLLKIITPEHIISSPAERAFQTAKIFAKNCGISKNEIELVDSIYEASMATLLKVINEIDPQYNSVLMAGHNPAFEFAVEYLSNSPIGHLPTSGIAIIDFQVDDWKLVSAGIGSLRELIVP